MAKNRLDRIEVEELTSSPATWKFGGDAVKGTEHRYRVTDCNRPSRNRWEFVIRVPDDPYGRIEVRPLKTPNDKALAGLDRRSITFMRGTRSNYLRWLFQVNSERAPSSIAPRRNCCQTGCENWAGV